MAMSYWLRLGRRTEGPLSLDEVRRRACRGAVTPAHSVSTDGITWIAARRCAELYGADGAAIAPHAAGPEPAILDTADSEDGWSLTGIEHANGSGADADPAAFPAGTQQRRAADDQVAAWPAQLACALTLAVACALPMARDAEGPLWWWHVVRVWDLGGAGPVTAAVSWALVSVAAATSSVAIWIGAGPGRLVVLTASAVASMALATVAWGTGMAGGAWTMPQCAMIPVALLACLHSAQRPAAAVLSRGVAHQVGVPPVAAAAVGALAALLGIIGLFARDGGAALAASVLMLAGGASVIGSAIRWRTAGPDDWTTLVPAGAAVFACGAILCDGIAALAATPAPPIAGTRFAVVDAVRVIGVLLCQCALAYLARRDHDAGPPARFAYAPVPGSTDP
jgi:hypothetical protein